MAEEIIHTCDICLREIRNYSPNGYIMVNPLGLGDNQIWPIDGGKTIDVCSTCCNTLARAESFGIISYDLTELYKRAGFVRD